MLKNMRKMDIFCASPASTAICSGTDQRSMVRRSHHHLTRRDVPCSSHLPIIPKPYNIMEKSRNSSSASKHHATTTSDSRRKSSADAYDLARRIISHRSRRPGDSTRYLLSHNNTTTTATTTTGQDRFIDWLSDHQKNQSPADTKPPPVLVRRHQSAKEPRHLMLSENHDSPKLVKSSSRPGNDQVVVLRVSLHCKGCEGKVRKHISKMEGVRSFSIEFDTKKVTVIGNVTAAGVLESLSRVKNAQLWPFPTSSSSSSSSSSSYSSSVTARTPSSLSF